MKHQLNHLIRSAAMAVLITGTATLSLAADPSAGASPRAATPPAASPAASPASSGGVVRAYPIRGTVGTADPSARTVALAGRKSVRVVRVDDNTQLTRDGNAITLAELQTGDYVKGLAFKNGGEETLVKASVGEKPPAPPRRSQPAPRAPVKPALDREGAQH